MADVFPLPHTTCHRRNTCQSFLPAPGKIPCEVDSLLAGMARPVQRNTFDLRSELHETFVGGLVHQQAAGLEMRAPVEFGARQFVSRIFFQSLNMPK